ncbi:fimbrial [Salmonella enterica subsp. enterica serovar Give]|uniref:F4 family fimbrial subunit n=1 Tax=Salmonella enterica TaxID=28901 RepID=UPI001118ACBF|nr:fimbrial [Salmonella enterica]ECC3383016.1 fimbrial [Salmonella enterica subsp. enterica serovar Manchester]ECI2792750.1 fimbrial [Salmonella enterica subsp. enterica serovar Give]EDG5395815.1 fimbrial [Salmonella enterica subsp. enterica serovar Bovismorbificans]EGZ3892387.1 fimbrial [Salmonella enterica subsp. enterica serovar Bonn]EDK9787385.1 fimbrial [Salmonella enterica subsp. enterica serovar Give]
MRFIFLTGFLFSLCFSGGQACAGHWDNSAVGVNGSVTLGGKIHVLGGLRPVWMWKAGGYRDFFHHTGDMTEQHTRLTVSAPTDILLLAGKSQAAFDGSAVPAHIVPVIRLTADSVPVAIQWISGSAGEGVLVLPLHRNGESAGAGHLLLRVRAFGALGASPYDGLDARIIQTLGDNTDYPYVFNGGVMGMNAWTTRAGLDYIARMTGNEVTADTIWAQLQEKISGLPATPVSENAGIYEDLKEEGLLYAGAYALGIPQGNPLELRFSAPVTSQITWRATLNVEIHYP